MSTSIFLTDSLGSILATFSNTAGSAALLGNQVYGPYGTQRYTKGAMGTTKGFTGQYNDSLTGLDYYNARYYDPAAAVFLSVDIKQGMNPYDYVGGNPETQNDPTGLMYAPPRGGSYVSQQSAQAYAYHYAVSKAIASSGLPALLDLFINHREGFILAESYAQNVKHTTTEVLLGQEAFTLVHMKGINWNANTKMMQLFLLLNSLTISNTMTVAGLGVDGAMNSLADLVTVARESADALSADSHVTIDEQQGSIHGCSFTLATPVTTEHGKQPIGTLKIGEKVLAYNPKTHQMELQPILHVWINQDDDLVDLTITNQAKGLHGKSLTTREVVHTNQKHPFLTIEKGFLSVKNITLGMHLLRADGQAGVVTGWKVVPGMLVMYNLEVQQDHTFTVGNGQWVVHNSGGDCGNTNENSGASDNLSQGDRTPSGSFTQLGKGLIKELGKSGFDPHSFKADFVGKENVSLFDIYKDGNDDLFLLRKGNSMSTAIDTGYNMSDFLEP